MQSTHKQIKDFFALVNAMYDVLDMFVSTKYTVEREALELVICSSLIKACGKTNFSSVHLKSDAKLSELVYKRLLQR